MVRLDKPPLRWLTQHRSSSFFSFTRPELCSTPRWRDEQSGVLGVGVGSLRDERAQVWLEYDAWNDQQYFRYDVIDHLHLDVMRACQYKAMRQLGVNVDWTPLPLHLYARGADTIAKRRAFNGT